MNVRARAALQGAERRAKIDSETVKGLQLMNGGAAAALLALLPTIIEKPGLSALAFGALRGLICASAGLALAVIHNRLRRKCSHQYTYRKENRKPVCGWLPKWLLWIQSVPGEPCICTRSVIMMWLSVVAFIATGGFVGYGAQAALWVLTPTAAHQRVEVRLYETNYPDYSHAFVFLTFNESKWPDENMTHCLAELHQETFVTLHHWCSFDPLPQ